MSLLTEPVSVAPLVILYLVLLRTQILQKISALVEP